MEVRISIASIQISVGLASISIFVFCMLILVSFPMIITTVSPPLLLVLAFVVSTFLVVDFGRSLLTFVVFGRH